MRDSSSWCTALVSELADGSFPESGMDASAFCAVELGLSFLHRYLPGEPVGSLQALLSGYVRVGDDTDAVVRRVRHRMGDVSRRGYWRTMLNRYMAIPQQWRIFKPTGDTGARVGDSASFELIGSVYCPERRIAYDAAMTEPLEYRPAGSWPPAEAGGRYSFRTGQDREIHVQLPRALPSPRPVAAIVPRPRRVREPWDISFPDDLERTARWVDDVLAARPEVTNRDWERRLRENIRFSAVVSGRRNLVDRPATFRIDGLVHMVGLMNSGKTTLTDLIAIDRVRFHGNRVGVVVSSVSDVLAKVGFFRTLGINAVPLIGSSTRAEHVGRYWGTVVVENDQFVPGTSTPDPAAAYTNVSCLLEPFRRDNGPNWTPIEPGDFPCRGTLRSTDGRNTRHDCPLLSICPAQRAYREIAEAEIWVTTPQCLLGSRAEPATVSARWFEAAQWHLDLLIIDEADAVQQVFDDRFVQEENLVGAGRGWSHRMVELTNEALADRGMAPASDADVRRWNELLQIHEQAVFNLNSLALSPSGNTLSDLLGDAPFTAHSLWRRVIRTLFGLPERGEGEKPDEEAADEFYRRHLQTFAEDPFDVPAPLEQLMVVLTAQVRREPAVTRALDAWIDQHTPSGDGHPRWPGPDRRRLGLIIEAAIWAGSITATFFRMSTMYPSIRAKLSLPDEERFWAGQPPRDYRSLVPEAPMGNILALRWTTDPGGGATLRLLWVHGVGRWLLHHAHDLLSCEGVDGPHVILTSATSWAPGSSFYHIPITPSAVLLQPDEDRKALLSSHMQVRSLRADDRPLFVSGLRGERRHDALRQMVSALCRIAEGSHCSVLDELRAELPEDRRKVLFVVLSGKEAETVGEHLNRTAVRARFVVPDAADPGLDGIRRRLVGRFGRGADDVLVAAEMSIQRGYNILNAADTAALGAVVYLTRSHPPPFDLAFPLSLVSRWAMDRLRNPPHLVQMGPPGEVGDLVRQMRNAARRLWFDVIGSPVRFQNLDREHVPAFVANLLVPMSQTIGRTIRGNQPTRVLLCDAAFAPRLATGEKAADTERTSIVLALDAYLADLLREPSFDATDDEYRLYAVNKAVWELMNRLVRTNDPLGTDRTAMA
ncbi:hypothetical protein ACPCHT_03190 [Nucisporomicrobium flavum]|uniref:pPIWI_RE_Z domain-containing protein n=1 Tax=Nucisporomicrobium flavum TaxID=2785915 RepID=UPI003C2B640F